MWPVFPDCLSVSFDYGLTVQKAKTIVSSKRISNRISNYAEGQPYRRLTV